MRSWPWGLAPRLILALILPIAALGFAYGQANSRIHEEELVDGVVDGASQLSRSIASATWHAMLADRRSDAYEVMDTIGRRNGIDRIRLFDNQGRVAFSTSGEPLSRVGKDSETCAVCHAGGTPLVRVEDPRRSRIFAGPDGIRRLGVVTAIYNEPSCSQAACHAHPPGQTVLGVLDVTVSLEEVDGEIAAMKRRSLLLGLAHVGIVIGVILVSIHLLVSRPIRRLIESSRAISEMDLDRPVGEASDTELGALARAFDRMRLRLRDAMGEIEEARRGLERKVEEKGLQLQGARKRLVEADRLASLGRLAGVVAHEINNPIAAVRTFSEGMQRIVTEKGVPPERAEEFRGHLAQVSRESARVGRIVQDLLSFARRGTPQIAPSDLNAVVLRTLALLEHKLELGRIEVEARLAENLPRVPCDPSQIEQVVLNLVANAAESMPGGGRVSVRTSAGGDGESVVFEVRDRGIGIPEGNQRLVFEPFFTTKETARGVGLGLSVVLGIVQSHGGVVDFESEPGRGTTFRVQLPLRPPPPAAGAGGTPGARGGTP